MDAKKNIFHYFFISLIIFFSGSAYSETKFSDFIDSKDSWIYQRIGEGGDELLERIDTSLQEVFQEKVLDALLERLQVELGDEMLNSLSSIVGFGPMLSVMSSIGNDGPSESQIMVQVLLEAISDSQYEIIDAVEEIYQDDTMSRLDALLLEHNIFNSRAIDRQQHNFKDLVPLSRDAGIIKKRLEQRENRMVENSHLYMLAAGLHIEIQKQYTRWSRLDQYPSTSEEEIAAEYMDVFRTLLRDSTSAVAEKMGSVSDWRQSYRNSFGRANDIQFVKSVSGDGDFEHVFRMSYTFNGDPVEFTVLVSPRIFNVRIYVVLDATGVHVADELGPRGGYTNHALQVARQWGDEVIGRHKADEGAFSKYVHAGYPSVAKILDDWWEFADISFNGRQKLEIDEYIDSCSPDLMNGEEAGPIPSVCFR